MCYDGIIKLVFKKFLEKPVLSRPFDTCICIFLNDQFKYQKLYQDLAFFQDQYIFLLVFQNF